MMTSTSELFGFSMLSRLAELRNAWEQDYSERAQGGLLALSGFGYQFLLTLLKIVNLWKASTNAERQDLETARKILAEAISDIIESGRDITFTQVKRTISVSGLRDALEELWEIFKLASERTPDLKEHLRFVISGQFEGDGNPQQVIQGWRTRSKGYPQQELEVFKERVSYELVPDPKFDLSTELQVLARDENTETTIARWLGYLLQLGSGFSPESISTFIWKELSNDGSIEAFQATLARLFSLSHSRLCVIRETLGDHITLPRAKLSDLRASLFNKNITLLIGSSGSGKSALCKLGIQKDFKQNFDCLFLHASDIASFTESSDVITNRGLRRLDELLTARITHKPILVIIDDLSDVGDQHFDAVLNLLHNTLTADPFSDVRFILVVHIDARGRIHEKISARFGNDSVYDDVELPQLPVEELVSSEALPDSVISLIQRHREFGPALNLKLIDWLVRRAQREQVDTAVFQSDLDLLTWFWHDYVQDSQGSSNLGQVLIRIAKELAARFTPDLPRDFDPLIGKALHTLVRRDCLRIVSERLATTHRFIGDCARFYYLRGNRREIESEQLVEWLQNPFWVQPIRWFALQLALESSEGDTWQEFLYEALEGEHLQLLDLLLDGAILSKQPASVLQMCPDKSLPFVIERLITRLLAIATEPYPFHADGSQSTPLRTRIVIQEQITGIPKPDLWEPVWHWLLSQNLETVMEESCIVFRAAEAWLNWSVYNTKKFLLRSEVAEFTLDLAQRVLLPDPDPEARIIDGSELAELIKLRQQCIPPEPEPVRRRSYYLGDFESNTFSCIVFALRIIPKRSAWFLRVLAGREIVPTNKLEPTRTSRSLTRPGIGVLETPHPQGPLGAVSHGFRKFMLNRNGLFLNAVMLTSPQLGVELFLGLTIQPPRYRYDSDADYEWRDKDLGTEGSDDIDVCTFKFLPLLSLLEINEEVAIHIVDILCRIATLRNYEICESLKQRRNQSEEKSEVSSLLDSLRTDTHELPLIINGTNKKFQGERKALYWHRNGSFSPKIVNCLLMTLEGWLYSRPSKSQLEHSISIIFRRGNTVGMLGVLVTLAKCDFSLLSGVLLPLVSSLQLLIWLEFEQIDRGQNYEFDNIGARRLSGEDRQKLLEFNQLSYRRTNLQKIIFNLWINEVIPSGIQSQILENWDTHQLPLVPEVSLSKALKIRAWFELDNWKKEENSQGEQGFRFVGTLPDDAGGDAKAESASVNILHLPIAMTCRQIIDGEQEKTLELHDQLVDILTSEEKINFFRNILESQAFNNFIWAVITILLEPPVKVSNQELELGLNYLAEAPVSLPIALDNYSRCQLYNLDDSAFRSHIAPKLIKKLESNSSISTIAVRCLIGVRNQDTFAFMRSWIKEYGLKDSLTKQLVNVIPFIARLLHLTYAVVYVKHIQEVAGPDGSYIVPRPEEIDYKISKQADLKIQEAWLSLQNDFVEEKLQQTAIVDTLKWVPKVLIEPIQKIPNLLQRRFIQNSLDWNFLMAALVSILETKIEDEDTAKFVSSLCGQIIFALVYEREGVYKEYKNNQENNKYSDVHIRLYEAQYKLLDKVIEHSKTNILSRIDQLIYSLKSFKLIDCILLKDVINTLIYNVIDNSILEINHNSLKTQIEIAFTVGNYLCEVEKQSHSDLQILGKTSDVWEKLIEFLSIESKIVENRVYTDKSLVKFFNKFKGILFPHWWLRRKLYDVAKFSRHKHFRRNIFNVFVLDQELLPSSRDDESEALVQVLAELWDTDYNWIISQQSRCQNLQILLGKLQDIDAVGARNLANQIANFLSSFYN